MNKKSVLTVKNLNKIYSKKGSISTQALKNLNLQVKEGEIFGLLGPNGAGKSTFINILGGSVIKTGGEKPVMINYLTQVKPTLSLIILKECSLMIILGEKCLMVFMIMLEQ